MLALILVLVVLVVTPAHRVAARRLGHVHVDGEAPQRARRHLVETPAVRLAVCLASGAAVGGATGGLSGVVVGAIAGVALSWGLSRLEPPSLVRRRLAVQRDLPLAVDLLAACSDVGLPPERALRVVAASLPGPLGDELSQTAARLALGTDPAAEWHRICQDPALAPLGRTMLRSVRSGAPLVSGLMRLADDRRRDRRMHAQVQARKVGVQAAGPLGLCFLPSFMVVGVVPTVVGAFSELVLG